MRGGSAPWRGGAGLGSAQAGAGCGGCGERSGVEWGGMAGALTEVLGEVLVAGDGEEVAVSALAARGVSLVGLYFGCSLGGPCAQLGASLAAFYGRFRGEAAAAGGQRLEIVFVSAEQEQQQWQEAVRAMPWLALPFADKHRKVRPRAGGRPWPGGRWGGGGRLCLGAAGLGRPPPPRPPGPPGRVPRGEEWALSRKFPGGTRGGGGVCVCVSGGRVGGRLPSRRATLLRLVPPVPGPGRGNPTGSVLHWWGGGGKGGGNPGLRVVVSGGGAVGRHPLAWRGPSEERGRQARRVREVAPLR